MRKPGLVIALALAALLAGAGLGLWLTQPDGDGPAASAPVGGPFRLTAHDGRAVTEADFKGTPVLMFFGFTHCPDICPTALYEITQVLERLGPDAARVQVLFVSVDPERDTPQLLASYLSSFHPRILGLSGDAAATAGIVRAFRVYAKKVPLTGGDYTIDHSAVVYLLDKDGRFVAPFNIKRPPEEAAAELTRYF
jgi:protein SCO1/2